MWISVEIECSKSLMLNGTFLADHYISWRGMIFFHLPKIIYEESLVFQNFNTLDPVIVPGSLQRKVW